MLILAVIYENKNKPSPGLFQILLNFDNSLERFQRTHWEWSYSWLQFIMGKRGILNQSERKHWMCSHGVRMNSLSPRDTAHEVLLWGVLSLTVRVFFFFFLRLHSVDIIDWLHTWLICLKIGWRPNPLPRYFLILNHTVAIWVSMAPTQRLPPRNWGQRADALLK